MGDGPLPASREVVPAQVAEIIVALDSEPGRRGSGYRVGPTSVLTAAHVIEGAVAVRVRFDADLPGEWTAEVISRWADPRSDLAVLTIAPREGEPAVAVARFGRIGGDRAAVLAARSVGFPRFKLKTDDDAAQLQYRDSHQADGSVAVLSNRREGTLELTVPPPDRDLDPAVSPWEGMSGAAVWIDDRIVGVIAKHHRSDGLGRLAAARLDLALADLEQRRRDELWTLLDLPDVLPDVVPPSTGEWVRTAYQAQVRDIAPDRLLDRDAELDELVGFCAGDQPYAWWQAGPWAGKSALMSWFVLHPPAGVDVVSFFITARLAGQSDSDACTTALIEQLAALTGESPANLLTVGARRGTMLRLLEDAASRSREAGRRLVLVIDGLDEDSGTATGPSIAALLSRRPPPEVRILVTSRPHPGIPDDVAEEHPLRTINPKQLYASKHALDIELQAKIELKCLLMGDQLQRDVLGLITASGGGLTLVDLEQLTERPRFEIDGLLSGLFGRTVGSRIRLPASSGVSDFYLPREALGQFPDHVASVAEQIYLFTHETLRLIAERQYGNSLAVYRDRLYAWADSWRHRGWPTDTPQYLLRSYIRMLKSSGDALRLIACATDQARHNWIRGLTGDDMLVREEVSNAQQFILTQPEPELVSLTLLTCMHSDLINFGRWQDNQFALDRRDTEFSEISKALAVCGDHDRAELFTRQIIDSVQRRATLTGLVKVVGAAGDHHRAIRLADEVETLIGQIADSTSRCQELRGLAKAVAVCGYYARAELLTMEITNPLERGEALIEVASTVGVAGDRDRAAQLVREAERLVGHIKERWRIGWLARLAKAMAVTGDAARAAQLASEVEMLIVQFTEDDRGTVLSWNLYELVAAVAAIGDYDWAETLTTQITEDFIRARTLAELTEMAAARNDRDRAARLAGEAERLTGQIADGYFMRESVWSYASMSVAATGDYDRAEALIAQLASFAIIRSSQAEALITLVKKLVESDKETSPVRGHAGSGSPQMARARRLVAEALVAGSWPENVAGLVHVDPFAIIAIAEGLRVRWGVNAVTATPVQTTVRHPEPARPQRTTQQWARDLLRRVWGGG